MRNINVYIIEKLRINKDTNIGNFLNAKEFQKDDILYVNPNISINSNETGKPGIPSFYKVISNNGKRLTISPILSKIEFEKDEKHGIATPNEKKQYKSSSININKDGLTYYGGNVLCLWDGNPIKFYK